MKFFKIISINILLFIVFITFVEIIFVQINKHKIKCSYVLCNYNLTYTNNRLYEPYQEIHYKKDEFGFRGRTKEISDIDILVFGGSTTDERYLNLEDTWTEKLEYYLQKNNQYRVDVVNAGIDGQSTFGHIWNFDNWINKIENFNTKYIIFYIGINDNSHSGFYDLDDETDLNLKQKIIFLVKNNNAFLYEIFKIYLKFKIKFNIDMNPGHQNLEFNKTNYELINLNKKNLNTEFASIYKKNLEKLINLTNKIGAKPIFITQRTMRWYEENGEIFNLKNTKSYESEVQRKNVILNFCEDNNIFCINIFDKFEMKEDDTYDGVHLNPKGANKVAKMIADEIILNKKYFEKLSIK